MTRVWAWGAGWDSTAGIIRAVQEGERIDLVTFADVGGEKDRPDPTLGEEVGTYEFVPIFQQWCRGHGVPEPVVCEYRPGASPAARYRQAAGEACRRLGLTFPHETLDRLSRLFGNMVANETLPGLAFGPKSCSIKWKRDAQEPVRASHPVLRETWDAGGLVEKCIGFDATEDHRVRTYADGRDSRYRIRYPLREWGLDRAACGRLIKAAGLPLPPKSACFFCPAMRPAEIARLLIVDPDRHALAIEMERLYREGAHFRGDDAWTVGAIDRDGERLSWECRAESAAEARELFRRAMDDRVKPHRWRIRARRAVPGLGRDFQWGPQHGDA